MQGGMHVGSVGKRHASERGSFGTSGGSPGSQMRVPASLRSAGFAAGSSEGSGSGASAIAAAMKKLQASTETTAAPAFSAVPNQPPAGAGANAKTATDHGQSIETAPEPRSSATELSALSKAFASQRPPTNLPLTPPSLGENAKPAGLAS